jgi:hypothetical protein
MSAMVYREPNRTRWVGVRPAHNGEEISKSNNANNATVIIYTVSALKTLFLTGWIHQAYSSGAGTGFLFVTNAADVVQYTISTQSFLVAGNVVQIAGDMFYPIEIAAGYKVKIMTNALAVFTQAFIHGWEE